MKLNQKYVISTEETWDAVLSGLLAKNAVKKTDKDVEYKVSEADLEQSKSQGANILEEDRILFNKGIPENKREERFTKMMIKGGTFVDQISALTLSAQKSPVHNIKSVELLLGHAKKKNKRQTLLALDALRDLFIGDQVAPGMLPSRKLRFFVDNYNLNYHFLQSKKLGESDRSVILALFMFEEKLKNLYFEFLELLESLLQDTLQLIRLRSINVVYQLLISKPEQEQNLLNLIVNKLGDSDGKVSSAASSRLLDIISPKHHPAMKSIVCRAIGAFVLRVPVEKLSIRYHGIITMNQIILNRRDAQLAEYLVDFYLALFKAHVELPQTKKPMKESTKKPRHKAQTPKKIFIKTCSNHKMIAAQLTGVHRALPFLDPEKAKPTISPHVDMLFGLSHHLNLTVQIHSLLLLMKVNQSLPDLSARFHRAVYKLVGNAASAASSVVFSSRQQKSLYLHLIYKVMSSDTQPSRVAAFAKRLLQHACHTADVGFVLGALWVVIRIISKYKINSKKSKNLNAAEALWNMICIAKNSNFDASQRSGEYSGAENSSFLELNVLANHFHPSVQVYVRALLKKDPLGLPDNVDPLTTFTIARFLDKFVQKKPRAIPQSMNHSRHNTQTLNHLKIDAPKIKNLYIGDEHIQDPQSFAALDISQVAPDERFMHHIAVEHASRKARKLKANSDPTTERKKHVKFDSESENTHKNFDNWDDSSVDEDEIEKAIFASYPEKIDVMPGDPDEYINEDDVSENSDSSIDDGDVSFNE